MPFTLYTHQSEFKTDCRSQLAAHKRIIGCAATGFGKSKTMISILQDALARGRTVLVVTESEKIYRQLAAEIPQSIDINAAAKLLYIAPNKCYVAMAQTLARRPKLIEQFADMGSGLLIHNDEAHIGTATKLLLQLPNAYLVGWTATPSMKHAKHLPLLYNSISIGKQPEWLCENGYLTRYRHDQVVPSGLDTLKIKGGEFTEESQERVFDTANAHSFVPTYLTKYAGFRKCMIFCASIKSAESLGAYLTSLRIPNTCQHSKRDNAGASYELGQFHSLTSGMDICISVGSMNKGYDFPPVDLIFLYRATTSLPLYLQMCGRGSRLYPGKDIWTVVDFGANGKRHGRWDFTHDWANLWNKVKKKKEGVAPVKDCPVCMYLLPVMAMVCTNCGHEFKSKPPEHIDSVKSVMLEKVSEMKGRKLSTLSPVELAQWAKVNEKKSHAIRVAKGMECREYGYLEKFAKAMGYKPGWAEYHMPHEDAIIDFYDAIIK